MVSAENLEPWDERGALSIVDTALVNLTLQGNKGFKLLNTATTIKNIDASGLSFSGLEWVSGALSSSANIIGGKAVSNQVDISAAKAMANFTGGSAIDVVTTGAAGGQLRLGAGADQVIVKQAGMNANSFTTILDPHAGITITLPDHGAEGFNRSKLVLGNTASLQDYLNAAVNAGGDSSLNAHGAWFQFNNDSYYVQSQHNAVSTAGFVDGTDLIVKLTGLFDLSGAFMGGATGNTMAVS